jgi:hypothetical protein
MTDTLIADGDGLYHPGLSMIVWCATKLCMTEWR